MSRFRVVIRLRTRRMAMMRRRALLRRALAALVLLLPLPPTAHAAQTPPGFAVPSDLSSLADPSVRSAPADQLMAAAVEAFERGDLPSARDLARRALAQRQPLGQPLGQSQAPLHKLLAFSEYLLGKADQFEIHIRAALELDPEDADGHYHLGRYLYEDRRYREAEGSFRRASALARDHYKARYYEGLLAEGTGQPDRAKALFLDAIAIIGRLRLRYVWPHVDLGRLLVEQGEVERGVGWLYRAIRTDPELPYGHYEYAKALFRQEPTAEVERALAEAIRLDPGYASAYYLLARYYAKTGDKQRANETFARFKAVRARDVPSPHGLRR